MVGFRLFDVGLLVAWLVWFFRLRDDTDQSDDDGRDDHGGGPPLLPPEPAGGGGLALVMPGAIRPGRRLRDHGRLPERRRPRGPEPIRQPTPSRVRRPARRLPVRS